MNTSVNSARLIEKYISGIIQEEEVNLLQMRMASSKELQREFLLRQELESMFKDSEEINLKKQLAAAYNSYQAETNKMRNTHLKRIFYAAAAISGVTVGGFVTNSLVNGKTDATKLYSENFRPYPALTTFRSGTEVTTDSRFFRAMLLYKDGDYKSAIVNFEGLISDGRTDFAVQFYLGVSLMEEKEFQSAREYLKRVAESNSLLSKQANWYCALCYIGENKIANAKKILLNLKEGNDQLSQKATELLKQLPED